MNAPAAPLSLALLGHPNSGKTALFNLLTGSRQKVANYAGVTVERKEGLLTTPSGQRVRVLDLPGAYSLNALSADEAVTRDVVTGQRAGEVAPDLLVCVVDATNLQLGLRMVLETQAMGIAMVLALNMSDAARRAGITIDRAVLERELGMPVVETVGIRKGGAHELLQFLDGWRAQGAVQARPWQPQGMEQVLKTFKEYFLMTVGMMLYSFAWIGCIMPADGTGGGATGLSRVLCHAVEHWAGISIQIGTMAFLINGVLLLVAGFIIGWNFGVKTVFCVCVISLGLNFWQSVLPEGDFLHLERILSVILGGILAGIGVAICFMQGGSTGGTDIAAMIINKYRTISYGKIVIYSDFVIIGSSMLVGFHIDTVIYGYVMTAVFGYTVDMIMAGNQQSSQVFIVTHDYEKMAQAIVDNIHRGVTLIDSQGWYTKKESKIVMVVCRKRETTMILKFVKTIDPEAFMTVGSVMGVYGKGFQAISKP